MDVNCERLSNKGGQRHSYSHSSRVAVQRQRYDDVARSVSQTVATYALRSRRRSAAAAAAQRMQNATDTGGGERLSDHHRANGRGTEAATVAAITSQQMSAAELALAEGSAAARQNVCVICRQRVEECCTRCCSTFAATSAASSSSSTRKAPANYGQSLRSSCCQRDTGVRQQIVSAAVVEVATPTFATTACDCQLGATERHQWQPNEFDCGAERAALLGEDRCSPAEQYATKLTSCATSAPELQQRQPVMQQCTHPTSEVATTAAVCCSCRRRTHWATCNVPQTPNTAATASHFSKATTNSTTNTSPMEVATTTSIDLDLTTASESPASPASPAQSFATTATVSATPPTSTSTSTSTSSSSLPALAAGTKFIEQRQNMLTTTKTAVTAVAEATTTTTTTTSLYAPAPRPIDRTLRTFQLLLLWIQVQLLRPICQRLNSFLHKHNSNSNSNNNKHTTNIGVVDVAYVAVADVITAPNWQ
ncbi:serine-rich adhesin for platelets-like [Rhagoletis pomonella]|uniref:serine-rich adhesin for platelets-like n=1 Tax=Rhagoletis pomonella TaxID=28610 RepID=UPI001782ACD5|nr:serine-rich adhesin for platelets-like [Rhagoletis pomonella]